MYAVGVQVADIWQFCWAVPREHSYEHHPRGLQTRIQHHCKTETCRPATKTFLGHCLDYSLLPDKTLNLSRTQNFHSWYHQPPVLTVLSIQRTWPYKKFSPQGSTHPGKSWKGIFQACKVVENDCGHGKSWKSHGIPPIGHGFFNRRIIILEV